MSELVQFLWEQATDSSVLFSVDAVECWPAGMFDRLLDAKLLVDGPPAKFVPCDDCDSSHVEPVEWRDTVTEPKPFIRCPEHGPRQLELARLQQWKPNLAELANRTALLLSPEVSQECIQRIKTGRFTSADREEILEQLTGLPSESKLAKRRRRVLDPDAQRLALITGEVSKQARLLIEFLWNRRTSTGWNKLPRTAFRHGQSVKPETIFDALKDLRKLCTKNFASWRISITISATDQTVALVKDFSTEEGK